MCDGTDHSRESGKVASLRALLLLQRLAQWAHDDGDKVLERELVKIIIRERREYEEGGTNAER